MKLSQRQLRSIINEVMEEAAAPSSGPAVSLRSALDQADQMGKLKLDDATALLKALTPVTSALKTASEAAPYGTKAYDIIWKMATDCASALELLQDIG